MAGILVYALHDDEGNFNKNSLGAISEAAKLAGELGTEAAAARPGVENEHRAAVPAHGHARGVAAVSDGLGARAGDRPARPPELNLHCGRGWRSPRT